MTKPVKQMRNKSLTISLTIFLLLLLLLEIGFSQNRLVNPQRLLSKLDDRLKYAKEIVGSYGGKTAVGYLEQAKTMRDQAYHYFNIDRPLLIAGFIRKAYFYLDLAIRTTLANSGNRMAEQINEMLWKAEQIVADCPNREAQRLFLDAKKNHETALQKLNQGQIERGLEQMRIAYFLAEKVVKLCRQQSPDPVDKVIEEKERFEQLLARARQAVEISNDRRAQNHITQALKQADQAQKAYQKQNYTKSLDHLYKASRILWRAIEISKNTSGKNPERRLQNELERLNASLSELEARTAGNRKAAFLYRRAVKLRDEAQMALNTRRLKIARQKIHLAQAAVGRAHGFLGNTGPNGSSRLNRVNNELERLQEKLASQKDNTELINNPQAHQLLKMAEQNTILARQAIQEKNRAIALERILTAHQFLVRSEELAQHQPEEPFSSAEIRSQIELYDTFVTRDGDRIREQNNSDAIQLFDQAQKYRSQAEMALENDEMFVAQAFIEMAHQLLMRSREMVKK